MVGKVGLASYLLISICPPIGDLPRPSLRTLLTLRALPTTPQLKPRALCGMSA